MEKFLKQYMPPDYSAHGPALDRLNVYVHWLMLILFIGWGAYFLYVLWRFRASRNPRAAYRGAQTHFSTYSEAGIAMIEVLLLVAFSIPAWNRWATPPSDRKDVLEVHVVAEQFAWNCHYPGPDGVFGRTDVKQVSSTNPVGLDATDPHAKDDVVTINQLHFEVNRPTLIRVSSKDVIHSFSLPVMRVKQDAIPGMSVAIHFTPLRTSSEKDLWEIACAQLCGLSHYRMRGQIAVDTKEGLQKWLAERGPALGTPSS